MTEPISKTDDRQKITFPPMMEGQEAWLLGGSTIVQKDDLEPDGRTLTLERLLEIVARAHD